MRRIIAILVVMLFGSTAAFSHTLNVPFFSDTAGVLGLSGNPTTGFAGFIGVQNTTASPIVLNIVYLQNDPVTDNVLVQAPQQYTLAPGEGVSWRPSIDDPIEGPGLAVPNSNPSLSDWGSASIIWTGGDSGNLSIVGRYVQFGQDNAFSHVLETAN